MNVALIHDWLTGMRGGEKVLESLCELFPGAPIFTLLHIPGSVSQTIESRTIHTSFVQHAPFVQKAYRNYLPVFPKAVERFQLQKYDLIVSSSHCVAKGAIPAPSARHICYCHTPMRYIWSHYDDYFGNHRANLLMRAVLPAVRSYLCSWDLSSCQRVDQFVSNSRSVADRIKKYYGRESITIYPPVDISFFQPSGDSRGDFFLIVSALVPYKRIDIAIDAFNRMQRRLVIVGTGPDYSRLKASAGPTIEFVGRLEAAELREMYRKAAALIQPGEEDFGINMVEALACHCPVIAYARGGALEIVTEAESGLFFYHLSTEALRQSVDKLSSMSFNKAFMRNTAERFSSDRFKSEFRKLILSGSVDTNNGFQKE